MKLKKQREACKPASIASSRGFLTNPDITAIIKTRDKVSDAPLESRKAKLRQSAIARREKEEALRPLAIMRRIHGFFTRGECVISIQIPALSFARSAYR
jgi:hypothetical protein